jgi:hypothetical protein
VEHNARKETDEEQKPSPKKKPYSSPTIIEYGSVVKLTQTGGTVSRADSTNLTMRMPPCL